MVSGRQAESDEFREELVDTVAGAECRECFEELDSLEAR